MLATIIYIADIDSYVNSGTSFPYKLISLACTVSGKYVSKIYWLVMKIETKEREGAAICLL